MAAVLSTAKQQYRSSGEMWRHVTMVAKFLDQNNSEFYNSKKAIALDWKNNNFARASHFFVHFLAVVARLRLETSQFHSPALSSGWALHKNFLFLFLNLETVLSDSTLEISPTFDKLNKIK